MSTEQIAHRLVALCREAKWESAQRELYAPDAVSIEQHPNPGMPRETRGLAAIIEKGHKFDATVEQLHRITVSDPLVGGDAFACTMTLDATLRGAGRVNFSEICVYEVRDGKIASEQFFM